MRTLACACISLLFVLLLGGLGAQRLVAQDPVNYQFDVAPPAGASESFGAYVSVLSNGNVIVTDPGFDLGAATNVGAVYLYDGAELRDYNSAIQPLSRLTGSTTDDAIGTCILEVANSNFIVCSSNGTAAQLSTPAR